MNNDMHAANQLANAMTSNYHRDFWDVIKRIKGQVNNRPSVIDDITNQDEIANHFEKKV